MFQSDCRLEAVECFGYEHCDVHILAGEHHAPRVNFLEIEQLAGEIEQSL